MLVNFLFSTTTFKTWHPNYFSIFVEQQFWIFLKTKPQQHSGWGWATKWEVPAIFQFSSKLQIPSKIFTFFEWNIVLNWFSKNQSCKSRFLSGQKLNFPVVFWCFVFDLKDVFIVLFMKATTPGQLISAKEKTSVRCLSLSTKTSLWYITSFVYVQRALRALPRLCYQH